jgi:hypothetical protein
MNKSPETDDDGSIRRLLIESGTAESPELLEGLRQLRSFRALPAPAPTGKLAAMLAEPPAQPRRRSQRHRGLILSFALAGAMAAGTTGVAANNDLRLATESFCADVMGQVLGDSGEPEPPAVEPSVEPMSAGAPPAEEETPAMANEAAAVPETELAAELEGAAANPAPPAAAMPVAGEESPDAEVPADVVDQDSVQAPLPVPGAEPKPGVPDQGAQEKGKSGSHTITARPGGGKAGEGPENSGPSVTGPAHSVPAGGPGHSSNAGAGPRNSARPSSGEAPGDETPGRGGR